MHGDCGGQACEKYFCSAHLTLVDNKAMGLDELTMGQLCEQCLARAKADIADHIAAGDAKIVWLD